MSHEKFSDILSAASSDPDLNGKGGLVVIETFVVTVAAGVVVHLICKWLDRRF